MKRLSLIIAVLLAGCSGGGEISLPPPPPEAQLDAFYVLVSGVVAASSEDGDGKDVDSLAATSPDGSEPETL